MGGRTGRRTSVRSMKAFHEDLARAGLWDMRLGEAELQTLQDDLEQNRHPESLRFVRTAQREVVEQLADLSWSGVAGARLIVLVEHYVGLVRARDHFLPHNADKMAPSERQGLYLHYLWLQAEHAGHDPHDLVLRAVLHLVAGPLALEEVCQRFDAKKGHVGVYAAVFCLLARWEKVHGIEVGDDEVDSAIRRLRKLAWRRLPATITESETLDGLGDDLTFAVTETLLSRFGNEHPLEVMARALDGDLNITPRAIADHVHKRRPTRATD